MSPAELLCRTLALHGGAPDPGVLQAWRSVDSTGLAALVAHEECALWLYRRLRELNVNLAGTASGFHDWLGSEARRLAAANLLVDAHTEQLVGWLDARRVPHVLLKGAARRAAVGWYPMADARRTLDVDVLVPENLARGVWGDLKAEGYNDPVQPPPAHHHLPTLIAPAGVPVEIHVSTSTAVRPAEAWRRMSSSMEVVERNRVSFRVPSATELLWHSVTHAVQDGPHAFRLRYFLDAATVCAAGRPIDWGEVTRRLRSAEITHPAVAISWLSVGAALGGLVLPPEVTQTVNPFALRRVIAWRLAVLRGRPIGPRFVDRLLEEATRSELEMPLTPAVRDHGLGYRVRRRSATAVARGLYRAWCQFPNRDR